MTMHHETISWDNVALLVFLLSEANKLNIPLIEYAVSADEICYLAWW